MRPYPRIRAARRCLLAGLAALTAAGGALVPGGAAPTMALVSWNGAGIGSGVVRAATMPTAATPTLSTSGSSVTLSWAASLLPGGVPVQGYVVRRYTTLGVQATVGAACAGLLATTGCTETVVPDGTWRYGIIAREDGWVGPQGALATVTVNGPPQLTSLRMTDIDTDGRIDRVTATFDQTLAAYTAGTAPWTLANVPSGGTLASVSVSGTVATLVITEGAGAQSTAVGAFTVALAQSATGIRDSSGNRSSFPATAPTDGAGPVPTAIADTNGTTNGLFQPGDTLAVTFSEPLEPASVPTASTVTLTDPVGTGNDTLNVTGLTNGARATGSNGYLTLNGGVASWASTLARSNGDRTVTVTLGSPCVGTGCATLANPGGTPNFAYAPATSLTDPATNAATGTRTQAIRLF